MKARCGEAKGSRLGCGNKALECVLTFTAACVLTAIDAQPSFAVGRLGDVEIVTRGDGQVLPVYAVGGRNWVVGTPGQEYAIRFCNRTDGRVLAVMSVDGVNAVSGDTASPSQSGYVLNGRECADIQGWRKSLERIAAFYFTELPDAYATRTGRPENVGVIGVAIFRERPQPIAWKDRRIAQEVQRAAEADARAQAGAPSAPESRSREESAARDQVGQASSDAVAKSMPMPMPAPLAKLGTGHGRSEESPVQMVRFERESATPSETIAIHYDRRENLAAMGILPRPTYVSPERCFAPPPPEGASAFGRPCGAQVARSPDANPFPAWPRFVPDPPPR